VPTRRTGTSIELLVDASGDDVLKKTGIVVAAVATGLIALTPFAFADEHHGDWHKDHGVEKVEYKVDNSIDRQQYNKCFFGQEQGISSTLGLLPLVGAVPALPGPDTQTQTQTGNCTNVGDTTGAALPVVP
jgi:hypothetical protein